MPMEGERYAAEIGDIGSNASIAEKTPNQSRASTQGTMENVNLDPFFQYD